VVPETKGTGGRERLYTPIATRHYIQTGQKGQTHREKSNLNKDLILSW